MPDALTIVIGFAALAAGCALGWVIRARRSAAEKAAINEGWRDHFDAQGSERKRIEHQNRSLMRQVSELQLRLKDRDGHEQPNDAAANDEAAGTSEPWPESDAEPASEDVARSLRKAQQRAARLQSELFKWQERLPPLIERFRERDADAKRLEADLNDAKALIARYEQQPSFDETRAGAYPPGDPDTAADASNDMLAGEPSGALLAIKGIGPKTCRRLADIGFNQLNHLADASDEAIEQIDNEVPGARGKANGWRKQAISLLESLGER